MNIARLIVAAFFAFIEVCADDRECPIKISEDKKEIFRLSRERVIKELKAK